MAQFSIDINDDMLDTVWDSFASSFLYDSQSLPGETKQDFTRRKVIEWIKTIVINAEGDKAVIAARAAAQQAAQTNLIIE